MKILTLTLLIFAFSLCVFCHQIKQCPDDKMFGFKLGMNVAEAEKKAHSKLILRDMYSPSKDFQTAGLRMPKLDLGLQFYKGKLFIIIAIYDDRIRWQSVDAFTSWLSPSLNLKPIWTNIYQWDGTLEMSSVHCGNYNITATKSTPYGGSRSFAVRLSEIKTDELSQNLYSEQESKPKNGLEDKLKRYPFVPYDFPEPFDAKERELRSLKNKRYENRRFVTGNPNPADAALSMHDAEDLPQEIPIGESRLIIVGQVINVRPFLTGDKSAVYTEATVRIKNILKPDTQRHLQPGETITMDRTGGIVQYGNGQKILYEIAGKGMPETPEIYIFFLDNKDQSPNYEIITAVRLKVGKAIALDGSLMGKFNSVSEAAIIKMIKERLL